MPEQVRVTPEDLHVSAATLDTHADNVQSKHLAADARIDSAQPGLPANSAAATEAAMSKWQADTSKLFGRMIDHADGLRTGAAAYQNVDLDSASNVRDAASELDLGL
ncbi:WXG100 family type VII secretion target [Mycolicibacterium baixiangningiae]|uniref:WXG100 family type VII secretion target n=1 Tax=Mycolicibacterium baixiangningiae TaxID=2761578 RepID=UPI0018677053|nr:type VII secretion target [Mycolicibacterium baixiangningiae]